MWCSAAGIVAHHPITLSELPQRQLEHVRPLGERLDAPRIVPGQELRDREPIPHPRVEPEHAAHELPRRDLGDLRQRGDEALQRERRPAPMAPHARPRPPAARSRASGRQRAIRATVLLGWLAQRSRYAIGQRLDGVRKLLEIRRDLLELAAEMRLPLTGIVSRPIDRGRRRLALLRGKPEQLAGVGDVVLDEQVEPLVEGQALLQGADLLLEGLAVRRLTGEAIVSGAVHGGFSGRDGGVTANRARGNWTESSKREALTPPATRSPVGAGEGDVRGSLDGSQVGARCLTEPHWTGSAML